MLDAGFEHPDSREFGVYGIDFGYASWAGVSYHGFGRDTSPFVETMADFEIALQSIWLFCHLVQKFAENATPKDMQGLRSAALTIQNQVRRIKAIGPTDPTEVRMMCEAILTTSRLEAQASGALEAIAARLEMNNMTLNNKQIVLLVVDMRNGFLGSRSQHVLPSVLELVTQFRQRGLPVVFTRFHNEPDSAGVFGFWGYCLD